PNRGAPARELIQSVSALAHSWKIEVRRQSHGQSPPWSPRSDEEPRAIGSASESTKRLAVSGANIGAQQHKQPDRARDGIRTHGLRITRAFESICLGSARSQRVA